MNKKPQTSNKTQIAKYYGVSLLIFDGWIEINPKLKEIMKPYTDSKKRTLPPEVTKAIIEILGEVE